METATIFGDLAWLAWLAHLGFGALGFATGQINSRTDYWATSSMDCCGRCLRPRLGHLPGILLLYPAHTHAGV